MDEIQQYLSCELELTLKGTLADRLRAGRLGYHGCPPHRQPRGSLTQDHLTPESVDLVA
jgi:hypothetical protein